MEQWPKLKFLGDYVFLRIWNVFEQLCVINLTFPTIYPFLKRALQVSTLICFFWSKFHGFSTAAKNCGLQEPTTEHSTPFRELPLSSWFSGELQVDLPGSWSKRFDKRTEHLKIGFWIFFVRHFRAKIHETVLVRCTTPTQSFGCWGLNCGFYAKNCVWAKM